MSDSFRLIKGGEISVSPAIDLTSMIDLFKKEYGIHRVIAFSGGSDDRPEGIDDPGLEEQIMEANKKKETHILSSAIQLLQGYHIAILCGGTKWGVPHTAAQEAKKYGLTTIGIYPFAGKKHALGSDLLDLRICIEPTYRVSRWGDESCTYAKLLDGAVVYGGGAGTLVEVAHVLKMNEAIIDKGEQPKFIVPISGSGGVADGLPFIWSKSKVRSVTIPQEKITGGLRAAQLLIDRLTLEDFAKL